MSKVDGLFNQLPDINRVSIENVRLWLNSREDLNILGNELGNRVLYPHVIPVTNEDMLFNLGLIYETVKTHPDDYFDHVGNRILIPEEFLLAVPQLDKLSWAFIDAFHPYGCTAIYLKDSRVGTKTLGTLVKPNITSDGLVEITLRGQKHLLKTGGINTIPVGTDKADIKFESEVAELLGRHSITVEVIGGSLGIIVDLRS